jgi:hypothetical protein
MRATGENSVMDGVRLFSAVGADDDEVTKLADPTNALHHLVHQLIEINLLN